MNQANHAYQPMDNPFPGLRAFRDTESHLFFGREEHVSDVRKNLEANHFVAVVGTSGTGKSSLIRAGVLPSLLAEKSDEGLSIWEMVTITPGNDPLSNLAKVIAPIGDSTDSLAEQSKMVLDLISGSSLGLVQVLRDKIPTGKRLLILVDQFEEVFRFADKDSQTNNSRYHHFVRILIDTMRQRDVPIYIILTFRSDFLGDCVRFEGLPESINDGHYLVPRMAERQVSKVITGPIEYAKGKISPRLVQEILRDLGNDSDRLPILQHALMRTFEVWQTAKISGDPIDSKHLQQVGGLKMALSKHADEAYNELNTEGRKRIKQVLKCLTVKTADNRGVRRPMKLQELAAVTENTEDQILSCLKPFRKAGRSFILPDLDEKGNSQTIFDISHESLMRGWNRLRDWTDEEMESTAVYNRICDAAMLHHRGEAALWRDPELQLAIDWKNEQNPTKNWGLMYQDEFELGMAFLEESRNQNNIEKNKNRHRKVFIRAAIGVFLVIVSLLSGWALLQTNIATEKSLEAEAKSQEAISEKERAEQEKERAEAEKANAVLASEEAAAARDNAEAQTIIAENQSQRADAERTNAEIAANRAIAEQNRALEQENIANERSQEVLIEKQKADSARDEATRLRMISLSQNLAYESEQVNNNSELAALLAIKSYELAKENGGTTNSQSIYSAARSALSEVNADYSSNIYSTDNKILALQSVNGKIAMVDDRGVFKTFNADNFNLNEETQTGLRVDQINTAYISPNADRFVIGLNSNDAKAFTLGSNVPTTLIGQEGLIRAVSFQDGTLNLLTAGRDGNLILWTDGQQIQKIHFDSKIRTLSTLPNSDAVYVGCEDGKAYAYSISKNEKSIFQNQSGFRVEVISQSTDGSIIAIGYSDGRTLVCAKSGQIVKTLSGIGSVNFIAVSKAHGIIAVTTTSRRLEIYDLNNLTKLPIEIQVERPISSASFDASRGQVFLTCSDRSVHKYEVHTAAYIAALRKNVTRPLTNEEWSSFLGEDVPYENFSQTNMKKP